MPCYAHSLQLVVNTAISRTRPKKQENSNKDDHSAKNSGTDDIVDLLDIEKYDFWYNFLNDFLLSTWLAVCFAFDYRDLNEAADDPNSTVAGVIAKCKRIVQFFNQSPKAASQLKKECRQRNVPYKKLINSVSTRWNSTYSMVSSVFNILDCIDVVLVRSKATQVPLITEDEREVISDIMECLKPFLECTEELSGQSYVSLSKIIPFSSTLRHGIEEIKRKLKTDASQILAGHLAKLIDDRLLPYEGRTNTE